MIVPISYSNEYKHKYLLYQINN